MNKLSKVLLTIVIILITIILCRFYYDLGVSDGYHIGYLKGIYNSIN